MNESYTAQNLASWWYKQDKELRIQILQYSSNNELTHIPRISVLKSTIIKICVHRKKKKRVTNQSQKQTSTEKHKLKKRIYTRLKTLNPWNTSENHNHLISISSRIKQQNLPRRSKEQKLCQQFSIGEEEEEDEDCWKNRRRSPSPKQKFENWMSKK